MDDHQLAIWGLGEGDVRYPENVNLIPGIRVVDARTGKELRWFAGPEGRLFFDRYLFSCARSGTAVWDAATGEQLHHDPRFQALRYHPGAREFLTLLAGGDLLISRLQE